MTPRTALVFVAAGEGRRVGGDVNKVLLPLAGCPVLLHSVRAGLAAGGVREVVVVVRAGDRDDVTRMLSDHDVRASIVVGGDTRHESEWNALRSLAPLIDELDVVAIHDAARPLASTDLFCDVISAAHAYGACIPGVPRHGLLERASSRPLVTDAIAVQTPQAFRARALLDSYAAADADGFTGSDTASSVERYGGITPRWVESDASNLKITYADDIARARRLLED